MLQLTAASPATLNWVRAHQQHDPAVIPRVRPTFESIRITVPSRNTGIQEEASGLLLLTVEKNLFVHS